MRWLSIFVFSFLVGNVSAQEIHEYMDLQLHPCMHVPYSFFGEGLEIFDEANPPDLKWKHQLTNVNYANYLRKNKGARIWFCRVNSVSVLKIKYL